MTAKMGRYRYWGDQKPDTSRPLLTVTRPTEAVAATRRSAPADQPVSTGTLRIYGPIDSWGGWWGVSAKEVAQALDLLGDAERIVVRVNSPGGESSEGRAIMNLLRAAKAETVSVVDGAAYSAASYIAVGCDETVMSPGTTLMIHDTSTIIYGNAEALRKEADRLDIISDSGAELYAEVAGGTVEQWRDNQRAESWYTAATAVTAGLISRVGIVPDAGPAETAGDQGSEPVDSGALDERARAAYDLSLFDRVPGFVTEAAHQPPSASAVGSTHSTERSGDVAFTDSQLKTMRQDLGLPETADEATIVAALTEALAERAEPVASTQVPAGMVLVEEGVWNATRDQASQGAAARTQQLAEKRDRALDAAVFAGKITPGRKEHFAKLWDADPEGTAQTLASLAAGLVPTSEIGDGEQTDANADVRKSDAYLNWEF